jgi:hypothetical protein
MVNALKREPTESLVAEQLLGSRGKALGGIRGFATAATPSAEAENSNISWNLKYV